MGGLRKESPRLFFRMRKLLLAAVLLAAPAPLAGWSRLGHRVVSRLAEDRLTGDARKAIRDLLDGGSLSSVATWADSIRGLRPETGSWHFINLPLAASAQEWRRYCPSDSCVLAALDRFAGVLADRTRPRAERADALRFLVHFVADVHQPLHASNHEDHGGNDLAVLWHDRTITLHAVWDTWLIASAGLDEDQWLGRLRKDVKRLDRKAIERGSPLDWAAESHALARDQVYRLPQPPELSGEYAAENLPRAEDRLARAGIRLAALLNQLLKKG